MQKMLRNVPDFRSYWDTSRGLLSMTAYLADTIFRDMMMPRITQTDFDNRIHLLSNKHQWMLKGWQRRILVFLFWCKHMLLIWASAQGYYSIYVPSIQLSGQT